MCGHSIWLAAQDARQASAGRKSCISSSGLCTGTLELGWGLCCGGLCECSPGMGAVSAECRAGAPRRERVVTVRGAWMQAASCGVMSFFTLSRSIGKIFCTNASSCCLNSSAGYLASTCASTIDHCKAEGCRER